MAKKLTLQQIDNYCSKEEVTRRINDFVKFLDSNFLLSLYISYRDYFTFICEMESLKQEYLRQKAYVTSLWKIQDNCFSTIQNNLRVHIVRDAFDNGRVTSYKAVEKFVQKWTSKDNLDNMYQLHLFLFDQSHSWYERLVNAFGKEFYASCISSHKANPVSLKEFNAKYNNCMTLLEKAFPRGIFWETNYSQEWVKKYPEVFKKLDFRPMLKAIPFDQLFEEVFKNFAELAGKKNPDSQISEYFMTIRSREEIKKQTEETFKLLHIEHLFTVSPKFLNNESYHDFLMVLFPSCAQTSVTPHLDYFLYINALCNSYREECNRILDQLQKYLDENKIPYERGGKLYNQPQFQSRMSPGFMGQHFPS